MTQKVYDLGQNVVKTTEKYLKGDLARDQAYALISADCDAMVSAMDRDNGIDVHVTGPSIIISMELSSEYGGPYENIIRESLNYLKDALKGQYLS